MYEKLLAFRKQFEYHSAWLQHTNLKYTEEDVVRDRENLELLKDSYTLLTSIALKSCILAIEVLKRVNYHNQNERWMKKELIPSLTEAAIQFSKFEKRYIKSKE